MLICMLKALKAPWSAPLTYLKQRVSKLNLFFSHLLSSILQICISCATWLKPPILKASLLCFLLLQSMWSLSVHAQDNTADQTIQASQEVNMSRIDQAQTTKERIFPNDTFNLVSKLRNNQDLATTDPELISIEENLVFGELFYQGSLSDKQRILVLISSLVTTSGLDELATFVQAGLNLKMTPVEIKEAVYQCAPYVGLAKVKAAIKVVNQVFAANNITLPLPAQSQVSEEDRFEKGKAAQIATFGDVIDKMHQSAAPDQKYLIVDHLSAYCFGDIFTRNGLSHAERELVIFAAIMSLGGAESQLKSHAQGNLVMGNTKQNLFDVAALLVPYVGFPRTLNAVAIVNQL